MKTLLTVAGYDPSSGAGITADLAVFHAHGCFGVSAITALTVQSTLGVQAVHPVAAELLEQTLDYLLRDIPVDGVKIGMLATAGNVEAVVGVLTRLRGQRPGLIVVLDPVLRSSSGRELLSPDALDLLRTGLLPLVDWITPNGGEFELLLRGQPVQEFRKNHSRLNVAVTGGDRVLEIAADVVLIAGQEPLELTAAMLRSNATHGTGCAYSSALLCRLVAGEEPIEAARLAKEYVTEGIRRATPIGHGKGPMDLLWPLRRPDRQHT